MLFSLSFSTVFRFIPDIKHERYKPYTYEGKIIMVDMWALPLEDGYKDFFLFSNQRLTLETYLFFLFEHIILVLLAIALRLEEKKYIDSCNKYIVIQGFDTIIYLLAYGSFKFPIIPISWDFLKILIFSVSAIKERFLNYD